MLAQQLELIADRGEALLEALGLGGAGHGVKRTIAPPVNPLLLPPRLLLRALDDLHRIADAAGRLDELLERADALVERADRVDERAKDLAARLDEQADALLEQSRALHEQAAAILAQGERVEAAAREVAEKGTVLVDALPALEQAIEMARPLEGAVERLGRMVDRLPGARPRGTS